MEKLLHDVEEARQILSLGRSKFYSEVAAGRLAIIKVGAKTLVPKSSLDRYVAERIAEAQGIA